MLYKAQWCPSRDESCESLLPTINPCTIFTPTRINCPPSWLAQVDYTLNSCFVNLF